jgi:hypothetical protein
MEGFISINRKILEWEWYSDNNVKSLFIHCLLKANFKEKNWQGNTIKRGTFITSYSKLSFELNLSVKQIRTALDKLKKTKEINTRGTNKNTLVTVVKYNDYQTQGQTKDKPTANKGQTKGKQRATTNKVNKENKENKGINTPSKDEEEFDYFWEYYQYKKDRNKCFALWLKINQTDKATIFKVVDRYVKSTPDKQFRKNPATWLRGECWNNEILIKKGKLPTDNLVF